MLAGGGDTIPPKGYRLVKYVTVSSGNVWFPTGIYNTDEWTLDCMVKYTSLNARILFGAWYSNTYWTGYGLNLNYGGSRSVHGNKYSSSMFTTINVTDSKIKCVCTRTSCSVTWEGVTQTASSSEGFNGEQIYILGNGVTVTAGTGTGMSETTITRGGVEVAHFYPCVRESDNKPVFWNSVTKTDIENTGSGVAGVIELSA